MSFNLQYSNIYRTDTATYTLKDLEKEMRECLKIIEDLGIPTHNEKVRYIVEINKKPTKYLGLCTRISNNPITFEIKFNGPYFKVANPQDVHDTIMHEILHTLPGCMNHGKFWQRAAKTIESFESKYTITRLGNCEEYKELYQDSSKYVITCRTCGKKFYYRKRSKIVNRIIEAKLLGDNTQTGAFCPYCKSNNFSIEEH